MKKIIFTLITLFYYQSIFSFILLNDSIKITIKPDTLYHSIEYDYIDLEIYNLSNQTILTVTNPFLIEFLNDSSLFAFPIASYFCPNILYLGETNLKYVQWTSGLYRMRFTSFPNILMISPQETKIIRISFYDKYDEIIKNKDWSLKGCISFANKKDIDHLIYNYIEDYWDDYNRSLISKDTVNMFCYERDSLKTYFNRKDDPGYRNLNAFDIIFKLFNKRIKYAMNN